MFFVSIIISLWFRTEALTVQCDFMMDSVDPTKFSGLNDLYTCMATIIFTGDPINIELIKRSHMPGKEWSDVKGFIVLNQPEVTLIPRGLKNLFPNLESIHFSNTGLKEISSDDLEGLYNLRSADFNSNMIESIGDHIFKDQLNTIEGIDFSKNPIRNIGVDAFTNLTQLKTAYFYETSCLNEGIFEDSLRANEIVQSAISNCPSIPMMSELRDAQPATYIYTEVTPMPTPLSPQKDCISAAETKEIVNYELNKKISGSNIDLQVIDLKADFYGGLSLVNREIYKLKARLVKLEKMLKNTY